ncbi:hypothetical protein HK101_004107, partial [Irineochytrium annulatum]
MSPERPEHHPELLEARREVEVLRSVLGDAIGRAGGPGLCTPRPGRTSRGELVEDADDELDDDEDLETGTPVGTPTQKSAFSSERFKKLAREEEDEDNFVTLSPPRSVVAAAADSIPVSLPMQPLPHMPASLFAEPRPRLPRLEVVQSATSSSSASPLTAPILGPSSACLVDLHGPALVPPKMMTRRLNPSLNLGHLPPPAFPPLDLERLLSPEITAPLILSPDITAPLILSPNALTSPTRIAPPSIRPILKHSTSSSDFFPPHHNHHHHHQHAHPATAPYLSPPILDATTSWSSSNSTLCGDSGPPSPTLTASSSSTTTVTTPRRSDSEKSLTFDTRLERVCLFNVEDDPLQVGRNRGDAMVYGGAGEESEEEYEEDGGSEDEEQGQTSLEGAIWFSTQKQKPVFHTPTQSWTLLPRSSPSTHSAFSLGANVSLDAVRLDDTTDPSNPNLTGAVLVRNLSFAKSVTVRHTSDNWSTFSDLPAQFAGTVVPTMQGFVGIDRFTFRLPLGLPPPPSQLHDGARDILMAVRCTMGGREHWDNNGGANHLFRLAPRGSSSGGGKARAAAVEELLRKARAGSEAALRAAVNSGQAMAVEARIIAEQCGKEKRPPWQAVAMARLGPVVGAGGTAGAAVGENVDGEGRRWVVAGVPGDAPEHRDGDYRSSWSSDRPDGAEAPMEYPRRQTSMPSMPTATDAPAVARKREGGFMLR